MILTSSVDRVHCYLQYVKKKGILDFHKGRRYKEKINGKSFVIDPKKINVSFYFYLCHHQLPVFIKYLYMYQIYVDEKISSDSVNYFFFNSISIKSDIHYKCFSH